MRSSSRTGWFFESARHSLAAKGIRTGRGYFAKGNTRGGLLKSFLATPKKDAFGNPIVDPITGKPLYPKQTEIGIQYVKRAPKVDFSNPEMFNALQQQVDYERMSRERYSPDFTRLRPGDMSGAGEFAAPSLPPAFEQPGRVSESTPRMPELQEPQVTPQEQLLPEEEPVERVKRMPGASYAEGFVPSKRQRVEEREVAETPGVPPETRSLQEESFEVTI